MVIVTAAPPVCVQLPVPDVGATALRLILLLQVSTSNPASAVTPILLITTSSGSVHPSDADVTVQVKVFKPDCKLFTRVLYWLALVNVAVPTELHTPVAPMPDTSFPSRGS